MQAHNKNHLRQIRAASIEHAGSTGYHHSQRVVLGTNDRDVRSDGTNTLASSSEEGAHVAGGTTRLGVLI